MMLDECVNITQTEENKKTNKVYTSIIYKTIEKGGKENNTSYKHHRQIAVTVGA